MSEKTSSTPEPAGVLSKAGTVVERCLDAFDYALHCVGTRGDEVDYLRFDIAEALYFRAVRLNERLRPALDQLPVSAIREILVARPSSS